MFLLSDVDKIVDGLERLCINIKQGKSGIRLGVPPVTASRRSPAPAVDRAPPRWTAGSLHSRRHPAKVLGWHNQDKDSHTAA